MIVFIYQVFIYILFFGHKLGEQFWIFTTAYFVAQQQGAEKKFRKYQTTLAR